MNSVTKLQNFIKSGYSRKLLKLYMETDEIVKKLIYLSFSYYKATGEFADIDGCNIPINPGNAEIFIHNFRNYHNKVMDKRDFRIFLANCSKGELSIYKKILNKDINKHIKRKTIDAWFPRLLPMEHNKSVPEVFKCRVDTFYIGVPKVCKQIVSSYIDTIKEENFRLSLTKDCKVVEISYKSVMNFDDQFSTQLEAEKVNSCKS